VKQPYLEITFRRGKPFAAYLYLPRAPQAKSVRTSEAAPNLLVDYGDDGNPIGIEILSPRQVGADAINSVLVKLKLPPVPEADLAPLRAA
jgi:uncharacterized protein YuzE